MVIRGQKLTGQSSRLLYSEIRGSTSDSSTIRDLITDKK
jgi:hypothetical protein